MMKLTILACAFAVAASPLAKAADITITGLTTGLSPDQTKAIIGSDFTYRTFQTSSPHFFSITAVNADDTNVYGLGFADNKLALITHVVEFKPGGLPDEVTLQKQLIAKYGPVYPLTPPMQANPPGMNGLGMSWVYSPAGVPLLGTPEYNAAKARARNEQLELCPFAAGIGFMGAGVLPAGTAPLVFPQNFYPICHKVVRAAYGYSQQTGMGTLTVDLVDEQLAVRAANELNTEQTAAQAAALKKAQAVKPAL